MRLLVYICLSSAVVHFVRAQPPLWNRGVRDVVDKMNPSASLFGARGRLQQNVADSFCSFNAANWTDVTIPAWFDISQQCQDDVARYQADLFQGKPYAVRMLDSGGKPQSGILNGNLVWAGSYSQCLNVTRKGYNITFDGKFYLAYLRPVAQTQQSGQITDHEEGSGKILGRSTTTIIVGVCVPSSCTYHDVIQQLDGGIYYRFLVQPGILRTVAARSQKTPPLRNTAIAAICICGVLFLLLVSGTIYDVIIHQPRLKATKDKKEDCELQERTDSPEQDARVAVPDDLQLVNRITEPPVHDGTSAAKEGIAGRLLLCFSLYANVEKLLSTKQAPGSIRCLHGIRFISMTWVMLGHTYSYGQPYFDNLVVVLEQESTFAFQVVLGGGLAVDTFFFLSGLLMAYVLLKRIEKNRGKGKSVPYGMLYVHRYWRLTPTYAFVMMAYMWLLPYMFSTPFWPDTIAGLDQHCLDNWWTNLLYVNNVVHENKMCMPWTWYLANDMQFFVIGVPLVYLLYRWQVVGIAVKLLLLLASFIATAVITWQYHIPDGYRWNIYYYIKPYCRIQPYLVGVAVGWLLVNVKRKQGKSMIVRLLMFLGWCVAAVTAMTVLYSTYGQYHGTTFQTEAETVVYLTLHRTFWGMAIGWVVLACYYGYGGVVDTILSWDGWVPLSRLTYCAYLVHLLVIKTFYITRGQASIHYDPFIVIYIFLGHVTLSYGLAFLVSVAVEMPMLGLDKLIFQKYSWGCRSRRGCWCSSCPRRENKK